MKDEEIKKFIDDLSSDNGIKRQKARNELVKIGEPAIDYLIELQFAPQHHTRWEAIKALSQIAEPDSIPLLINSLEDEKFDVRWLAAEGLINIGKDSIKPLVITLLENTDSEYLREGVHHVLKDLQLEGKYPDENNVLEALESYNEEKIIIAAESLLKTLK